MRVDGRLRRNLAIWLRLNPALALRVWRGSLEEFKRRIDWAKLRAQAAKAQLDKLLQQRSRISVGMAAAAGFACAALIMGAAWAWLFVGLPRVKNADELWSLNRQPGVTFLDRSGAILGVRGPYYGEGVTLDELPAYVPQAFLAIEDRRFYEHDGVDRQAIVRAAMANLTQMKTVQGGSTITQQLCKNLFLKPDREIRRKLQEMVLAARVEKKLTKDEILEIYLNRVYLGEQAYGVDAAARRYFGKPATELTLAEAAMLAGLPKAPSAWAPTVAFEAATARQRVVIAAMLTAGFLTAEQAEEARNARVRIVRRPAPEGDFGYVFDRAAEEARRLAGDSFPDLVVRTTIDRRLQIEAARSVKAGLPAQGKSKRVLQAALVSVDQEGAVRALVGGRSYAESKFNRAVQAKRQPGSSFKTFVYAAAFEQGYEPDAVRYDEPITIRGWQPQNYYGQFRGAVTLRTAFAQSINTVAAELGYEIGPEKVAALAQRFGVASKLNPVPSIALGSSEVTLWEMTQAYATFMREGRRTDAHLVTMVENSRGETVYTRPADRAQQVYDPDLSHLMTGMMAQVVQAGTGTRARLPNRDAAGKTGTSQDWRDAWFVGYTADFTTGVWVGYDDYTPMAKVSGSGAPAEIWRAYMLAASRDLEPRDLPGYDLPPRPERDFQLASFYDALTAAFGFGDDDDDDEEEEEEEEEEEDEFDDEEMMQ